MDKIAVIHQPDFLPYLGFFHRLLHADLWVILDDVQIKGSKRWDNRDKIKTPRGERWLTVPLKKFSTDTKINEVYLSEEKAWRTKNINIVRENHKKVKFFSEIMPFIEESFNFDCEKLIDYNLKSVNILMGLFDIKIETLMSSKLNVSGRKNELNVNILKEVGATIYLSGLGAKDYFDAKLFEQAGIKVIWQDFKHPVYTQLYGEFIPYLSSIDLLFNCGIEKSREIIRRI